MHRPILTTTLAIALAGCGATGTKSIKNGPHDRPHTTADARGKFTNSCDLALGNKLGDYSLFASAKLRNVGNVGIKVRITAAWDQATSATIVEHRTARVPVHSHRNVKIRIPVTQSQVSEYQDSPDYFNGTACRVHATIIGSFGQPR